MCRCFNFLVILQIGISPKFIESNISDIFSSISSMSAVAMLSLTNCFRLFLRILTESACKDEFELETEVMEAVSAMEA